MEQIEMDEKGKDILSLDKQYFKTYKEFVNNKPLVDLKQCQNDYPEQYNITLKPYREYNNKLEDVQKSHPDLRKLIKENPFIFTKYYKGDYFSLIKLMFPSKSSIYIQKRKKHLKEKYSH